MSKWSLFVKHTNGKTLTIEFDKQLKDITVTELKEEVKGKVGIPLEEQRLIFAGKQLEDSKNLSDYKTLKLGALCTVFLVLRLNGGAFSTTQERDTPAGLPTSKTEPCLICSCHPNDDSTVSPYQTSRRMPLQMPCTGGHTVMHPHCLMMYAHNEVFDNRKSAICCSQCKTEWSLDVIQKYGVATKEEVSLLQVCLSENVINSDSNIIECPGCQSYCERKDKSLARVRCPFCAKEGKNCEFCWHCLNPWINNESRTNCGNPNCNDSARIFALIQAAPFKEVVGVSCPSIRLCPNCGTAIEHKEACKQMTCKVCQCEFCFICLRQKREGSWQCGIFNTKCKAAPVQNRIPKRV